MYKLLCLVSIYIAHCTDKLRKGIHMYLFAEIERNLLITLYIGIAYVRALTIENINNSMFII